MDTKTDKKQAVKYFTQDLPGLDIRKTTNYQVALLLQDLMITENVLPKFLISSVLASIVINVSPKVFRDERALVYECAKGLAKFLGNVYLACQEDFDTEVFRSMCKSASFVLDW